MARQQADQFLSGEAGRAGHGHANRGFVARWSPSVSFTTCVSSRLRRDVHYGAPERLCAQKNSYTCIIFRLSTENRMQIMTFLCILIHSDV